MKYRMRNQQSVRRISIANLTLVILVALFASAIVRAQDTTSAREAVEKYCATEFSGDTSFDRSTLIEYSRERRSLEQKYDPDFEGKMISWTSDSIYIVQRFTVGEITVHDTNGTCIVVYETLAKSKGYGDADREIVPQYLKDDSVSLRIIYKHNKWWIFDPPPPRISDKALIRIYEKEFAVTEQALSDTSKLSTHQRQYIGNMERTLDILKELGK